MARVAKKYAIEGSESVHYASQRKRRARAKAVSQPPLTPMIDMVFQLLTFFLMTMQFIPPEGQIPAELPDEQGPQAQASVELEKVIVHMDMAADDEVYMEIDGVDTAVGSSFAELHRQLTELSRQFDTTESPVVIKPTGRVPWGPVVNAYNQARRANYEIVGFAPLSAE